MSSRHNARKAAVQALYQWDLTQQNVNEIEESFRQVHDLQNVDKKYLKGIINELPLCTIELEEFIEPFLDRDFDKIDPVERAILRLAAFEFKYRPDVPTKVVINEMIELAKIFGAEHSYKFINGVVDKLAVKLRGK